MFASLLFIKVATASESQAPDNQAAMMKLLVEISTTLDRVNDRLDKQDKTITALIQLQAHAHTSANAYGQQLLNGGDSRFALSQTIADLSFKETLKMLKANQPEYFQPVLGTVVKKN